MKHTCALFDLDGVLVFSDRYHFLGWKRLADEMGWKFCESLNDRLRGVSRMESLQIVLDHNQIQASDDDKRQWAERKNRYYVESLADIGPRDLYPGAVDLLTRLHERGVALALCSSSRNAPLILDKLNLAGFFTTVVTGADIVRTKPDPEIFQTAARRLAAEPDQCVVFEDAPSGVEAAKAAGMVCVGVGPAQLLTQADLTLTDYRTLDLETLFVCMPCPVSK